MVDKPYSGSTVRAAHYAYRPSTPGVNVDHTTANATLDPFDPQPDTPPNQAGTVLAQAEPFYGGTGAQPMVGMPISHWYDGQAAVPSGEPYGRAQLAMQERMFADHSDSNYVPDSVRLYQHATEGQENDFINGRPSAYAGVDPGTELEYLVAGSNAYDFTNQPNEVYGSGGDSNVGRYRLGVKTNVWGLYENPVGKFGQEALLRAYTGLSPAFPVDKAPMTGTAPYTPNSTSTAHWAPAPTWQSPSLFGLPSETAVTDYSTANDFADVATGSDFQERGGLL
jgi:hypothetical protein